MLHWDSHRRVRPKERRLDRRSRQRFQLEKKRRAECLLTPLGQTNCNNHLAGASGRQIGNLKLSKTRKGKLGTCRYRRRAQLVQTVGTPADFKAHTPKPTNAVPGITYMLAAAKQRSDSIPPIGLARRSR